MYPLSPCNKGQQASSTGLRQRLAEVCHLRKSSVNQAAMAGNQRGLCLSCNWVSRYQVLADRTCAVAFATYQQGRAMATESLFQNNSGRCSERVRAYPQGPLGFVILTRESPASHLA